MGYGRCNTFFLCVGEWELLPKTCAVFSWPAYQFNFMRTHWVPDRDTAVYNICGASPTHLQSVAVSVVLLRFGICPQLKCSLIKNILGNACFSVAPQLGKEMLSLQPYLPSSERQRMKKHWIKTAFVFFLFLQRSRWKLPLITGQNFLGAWSMRLEATPVTHCVPLPSHVTAFKIYSF